MDFSKNLSTKIKYWYHSLVLPDIWEAPDREFPGHRDIITKSLARYKFIAKHLSGTTLEVGCGRGYGIELVENQVDTYIGIDLIRDFLLDASKNFPTNNFIESRGSQLPFPDDIFNSIISLEVIEHIDDDIGFLKELKRLLSKNGILALSTPNKNFASGNSNKPLDRFHVREYLPSQFNDLLKENFSSVLLFGQYEQNEENLNNNNLLNILPIRLKYMLPAQFQGMISVKLRSAINIDDYQFSENSLEISENIIALCQP